MRTTRALAVSAVAAAVVGLAAPAATAWESPSNIVAMPSVIARGGQLTVTVDGSSCQMPGSTVSSPVFPTTPLHHVSGRTSTATVTIDRNARPGSYDITARCGEHKTLTGTTYEAPKRDDGLPSSADALNAAEKGKCMPV
ncbi:hypothetical protein, partial [Streptomyces sp. NPDC005568]|uniref:hypothetical protein n=1 Tax=Streptomyces sp. NPDC005568 TaxID=3156887 RepID=UPI0033B8DE60